MAINTYFENIADAIRAKTGGQSTITPAGMPNAIAGISTGIDTMTRSQWNALSADQKRQYGLIGVIDSLSGYNRGIVYNGADYNVISDYLPKTDINNVNCFCIYDNFDATQLTWGIGSTPLTMSNTVSRYNQEDAVYLDARSGKKFAIPFTSNTPIYEDYTLYCVAKGISYLDGDVIVMGSVNYWSAGGLMMLYHRSGTVWRDSVYSNDSDLIDTYGRYVAVALRSNIEGSYPYASFFAYGSGGRKHVSYSYHGNEFTFGSFGFGNYSTDLAVKFIGMVGIAESDENISSNLTNLASIFNLT